MWHITNRCSLQCKFCFAKKEIHEIDDLGIAMYVDKFQKLMVQKVDISGGEPLAYPYLEKLCHELYKKGIYMTLTTRGIGLKGNICWLLENSEKFVRIIVSVDVPDGNMFENVSGDKVFFGQTENFIEEIKKKGYKNLRINTVVTRYLLDEKVLLKMIKWIKKSRCQEWCLIEPHPANQKDTFDAMSVKHREFQSVCQKIINLWDNNNCKILTRSISNYAGYWVLYPNGILAKHTEGNCDTSEIDFLSTDNEEILLEVQGNRLWLPEGGKMIYTIRNSEEDEFIALILKEVENNLKNEEEGVEGLALVEVKKSNNGMKGLEIQEIVLMIQQTLNTLEPQIETVGLGILSAALYDILKNVINKYKKMNEYSSKKIMEIEKEDENGKKTKIKVTLEEILK